MRRRLVLLAVAVALLLGRPGAATGFTVIIPDALLRVVCEAICAEKAKENCEVIDSMVCNFYVAGCLSGCNYGMLIKQR